jgi:hypothetical protein
MNKARVVAKGLDSLASVVAIAKALPEGTTEMSAENAIIVLLNDRNGRTLQEMARTPGLKGYTYDEVISAARQLENEGKLVTSMVRNETIFSLRNPVVRTGKNVPRPNPNTVLDAAIWDVMVDRKARNLDEIGDELKAKGYHNKSAVKQRVTSFLRSKKWFSVSGMGKRTSYTLNKDVQRPDLSLPDVEEEAQDEVPAQNGFWQNAGQEHLNLAPIEDEREEEEVETEEDKQAITRRAAMTPDAGDTLDVAIWKVMSDHTPATVRDIEALLEGTEHTFKTISPRMSVLYGKGWFARNDSGKAFIYTLKEGISMPVQHAKAETKPETPAVGFPGAEPAPSKTGEDPLITKNNEEGTKKMADMNAPLVEITVKLRGIEITKDDADNIVKRLNSVNLEEPKIDDDELLAIETKLRIKGQEFSLKEAAQIFNYLNNRGFG